MSEQAQHTPGPLLVKGDEVGFTSPYDDQSFGMFCPVAIVSDESYRNLFAAAPDLLAVLEDARTYIDAVVFNSGPGKKQDNYMACLHRIDAAIAKARGQS